MIKESWMIGWWINCYRGLGHRQDAQTSTVACILLVRACQVLLLCSMPKFLPPSLHCFHWHHDVSLKMEEWSMAWRPLVCTIGIMHCPCVVSYTCCTSLVTCERQKLRILTKANHLHSCNRRPHCLFGFYTIDSPERLKWNGRSIEMVRPSRLNENGTKGNDNFILSHIILWWSGFSAH